MKIRLSIEVSDAARGYIGSIPGASRVKKQGQLLARRADVCAWIEGQIKAAGQNFEPRWKLPVLERLETRSVVAALRALGWPDDKIKWWLLQNAAMLAGVNIQLWPAAQTQTATQGADA